MEKRENENGKMQKNHGEKSITPVNDHLNRSQSFEFGVSYVSELQWMPNCKLTFNPVKMRFSLSQVYASTTFSTASAQFLEAQIKESIHLVKRAPK